MIETRRILDYLPIHYHTAFKILSSELGGFTNFNLMANEVAEEFLICVEKKMTTNQIIDHFKELPKKDL